MNLAGDYARALFALIQEHPRKGGVYIKNLKIALARRGHEKLLPRILKEYERLVLREERSQEALKMNAKNERTRTLIELYQKLIHSSSSSLSSDA